MRSHRGYSLLLLNAAFITLALVSLDLLVALSPQITCCLLHALPSPLPALHIGAPLLPRLPLWPACHRAPSACATKKLITYPATISHLNEDRTETLRGVAGSRRRLATGGDVPASPVKCRYVAEKQST